jgi:hypothetical protein
MPDFLLEPDEIEPAPDEIEPETHTPPRPVRMVSTGLAPTAEVPTTKRRKPDPPPAYAPCDVCGAAVLTGRTQAGASVALDTGIKTYVVDWHHGTPEPVLVESRGYPVHRCMHAQGDPCDQT